VPDSETMRGIGITQLGDPRLRVAAEPYRLPAEATLARSQLVRLLINMRRVSEVHVFSKGMGLAAPQIGIGRAAAVVRPGERGSAATALFNPSVVAASEQTDEQYEGCLSFFDVRGLVPRPLWIDVRHTGLTGLTTVTRFENGLARLVAHEIDHLDGIVYTDRMRPGIRPIDVTEYHGTGSAWSY
jgi:peptide deformylase